MKVFMIVLILAAVAVGLFFLISYICYQLVFRAVKLEEEGEEISLPKGKAYRPHRKTMRAMIMQQRQIPYTAVSIRSFDGLRLCGKFYEYAPGADIELMMHGYRGTAERDLCGGVQRCFAIGRSALIVDQRACSDSEGKVITFGINERRDCRYWIDFIINNINKDAKIILSGISMGAATVLMAAGEELPENVVGVLADCGYTSAKEIIKKCSKDLKVPPNLVYPFIKIGAKIFGHFDLEEFSPLEAMSKVKLPIIFYHGDTDDFVPCYMSEQNYKACVSPKEFVKVPGAGHGLSYLVDNKAYLEHLVDFFNRNGVPTKLIKTPDI